MKKIILEKLMSDLKNKPQLMKKLKVFIIVGAIGFVLLSTLTVYLGVMGVRYIASVGKDLNVVQQTEVLKEKVQSLTVANGATCLSTVQGILTLTPLLEKPIAENYQALKNACFGGLETQTEAEGQESVPI